MKRGDFGGTLGCPGGFEKWSGQRALEPPFSNAMREDLKKVIEEPSFQKEFKVLSVQAEGGMGVVLKALQTGLNRTVAVKVLLPTLFRDVESVKRFLREARVTADLVHSNIVTLYKVGQVRNLPYLVYEFVDGEELGETMGRKGVFDVDEALELSIQILAALSHAHRHRVVHRDVKPENILVGPLGNVKVMDFGIALAETGMERLTRQGVIIGTPAYMAPEQATGKGISALSDVYAAGVILYEMLAGRLPWDEEQPMQLLSRKVAGTFRPLEQANASLDPFLCKVVNRCLALNPAQRPQSAVTLRRDLERFLETLRADAERSRLEGASPFASRASSGWATSERPSSEGAASHPGGAGDVERRDTAQLELTVGVGEETRPEASLGRRPRARTEALALQYKVPLLAGGGLVLLGLLAALGYRGVMKSRAEALAEKVSFESAYWEYRSGGKLHVGWIGLPGLTPLLRLWRSDGEWELPGSRELTEPERGHYETTVEDLDPYHTMVFSLQVPVMFGPPIASENIRVLGYRELAEEIAREAPALRGRLGDVLMKAGLEGGSAFDRAREDLSEQLSPVRMALDQLSALGQVVWEDGRVTATQRWKLATSLFLLEEVAHQAELLALDSGVSPRDFLAPLYRTGKSPFLEQAVPVAVDLPEGARLPIGPEGEGVGEVTSWLLSDQALTIRTRLPDLGKLTGSEVSVVFRRTGEGPYLIRMSVNGVGPVSIVGMPPVEGVRFVFQTLDPSLLKSGEENELKLEAVSLIGLDGVRGRGELSVSAMNLRLAK